MKNYYISWVGDHDVRSTSGDLDSGLGPVFTFFESLYAQKIEKCLLLHNKGYQDELFGDFVENFKEKVDKPVTVYDQHLDNPTVYQEIYEAVRKIMGQYEDDVHWHIQTNSGTPQMAAIWMLIATTSLEQEITLYHGNYNRNTGKSTIREVSVPFEITMSFLPDLKKRYEAKVFPDWNDIPQYLNIIHESTTMKKLIQLIWRISTFDVPVLIQGETGTGKELVARAIHATSARKGKEIRVFNCAAFNESTVEATLFGWSSGAWTGSKGEGKGIFKEADRGILFLDEIGDLSLEVQSKLLRVLEYGEIQRVGDGKIEKVDVRVITATHKNLLEMVKKGTFREDLYYRLSVAVLSIPPLRDRREDIFPLAKHFLEEINKKFKKNNAIDYQKKQLSNAAKKLLFQAYWSGNVRELYHTLQRAAIWEESDLIDYDVLRSVMVEEVESEINQFTFPINIKEKLDTIESGYVKAALKKSRGNLSKASQLLGYKSYQILNKRLEKWDIHKEDYE